MYDINLKLKNIEFENDDSAVEFVSALLAQFDGLGIEVSNINYTIDKFPNHCEINSLKEFREMFSDYTEEEIKSSKFNWEQISRYQLSEDILEEYKDYIVWDVFYHSHMAQDTSYSKKILEKYSKYYKIKYLYTPNKTPLHAVPIIISQDIDTLYEDLITKLRYLISVIDTIDKYDIENLNKQLEFVLFYLNDIVKNGDLGDDTIIENTIPFFKYNILVNYCIRENIMGLDIDSFNVAGYKEKVDDLYDEYLEKVNSYNNIIYRKNAKKDLKNKNTIMSKTKKDTNSIVMDTIKDIDPDTYSRIINKINLTPEEIETKILNKKPPYTAEDIFDFINNYNELVNDLDSKIEVFGYMMNNISSVDEIEILDELFSNNKEYDNVLDEAVDEEAEKAMNRNRRICPKVDMNSFVADDKHTTNKLDGNNIVSMFGNPDNIPKELWRKISNMELTKEAIIKFRDKLDMKVLISNPTFGKYMSSDIDFFDSFIDDAKKYQAKKNDGSSLYRINLDDSDI